MQVLLFGLIMSVLCTVQNREYVPKSVQVVMVTVDVAGGLSASV